MAYSDDPGRRMRARPNPIESQPYGGYGASFKYPGSGPGVASRAEAFIKAEVHSRKSYTMVFFFLAILVAILAMHRVVTGEWKLLDSALAAVAGGVAIEAAKIYVDHQGTMAAGGEV